MNVYAYDVELALTDRRTRETKVSVRREYAYDPGQAMSQATINAFAEIQQEAQHFTYRIVKVGPARELVEAAASGISKAVDEMMERLKAARAKDAWCEDCGETLGKGQYNDYCGNPACKSYDPTCGQR